MLKTRIIIVDDHQLFRLGVKTYLQQSTELEIVGETAFGEEVMQLVQVHQPDLVLMDVNLKGINGIAVTQEISSEYPNVKILALSSHEEKKFILEMVNAGALGYVLKDAPMPELVIAIKALAGGNSYFSRAVSAQLFANLGASPLRNRRTISKKDSSLTQREEEILKYIAEEFTNKEIASKLFISTRTVETHRRNLIQKLKVKNTVGLVKFYLNMGQMAMGH